ncbi:phasin family protein [Azohydromonas sp. G-1-1-14]|uniref:Phasin family protein n=1 Tax=Azohydromonas caseinilytica TaxID=2728836 RepID=A0A848FH00_9BURK|nr:phasin family protein [Azohydromonas caseinilytica]
MQAIGHSGQEIWLAGVGALYTARKEGSRLFELLVEEGKACTSALTGGGAEQVRARLGGGLGGLQRGLEKRVARALQSVGVPSAQEVGELSRRVAELDRHVSALTRRSRASGGVKRVKRKIRP